jgi:hypothetical protein
MCLQRAASWVHAAPPLRALAPNAAVALQQKQKLQRQVALQLKTMSAEKFVMVGSGRHVSITLQPLATALH